MRNTYVKKLNIVEDWRYALDKKQIVGAVVMNLSKAFDCLPQNCF